jgi:hypothetical protein
LTINNLKYKAVVAGKSEKLLNLESGQQIEPDASDFFGIPVRQHRKVNPA